MNLTKGNPKAKARRMPKLTLLIGHRGTGKSRLLERIEAYYLAARRKVVVRDLDREIERSENTTIDALFARRGEATFRELEKFHLSRLTHEAAESAADTFVVLGAGFPGPLPPGAQVLWVRRASDAEGRVFLDRPRLDPQVPALREYLDRYRPREKNYRRWASEELTLPEGFDRTNPPERAWFLDEFSDLGGALTLLPENFAADRDFREFAKRRLKWGVRYLELRDDLLLPPAMETARAAVPAKRLLFSFRRRVNPHPPFELKAMAWDWPADWGNCPHGVPPIVSLHDRLPGETVSAAAERLTAAAGSKSLQKLAVAVTSFPELEEGHRWASGDPKRRAFLPASPDGRWSWYRLQFRPQNEVSFFREGEGSSADQPLLLDWARHKRPGPYFAAILGDPIRFSRTPAEQEAFFQKLGLGVLAIRITKEDWQDGALEILQRLGLRYAAVTAPLKEYAFEAAPERSATAQRLASVNTLHWDGVWKGENTDLAGLREAMAPLAGESSIAVWGGGGTLAALREVLPQAVFYSARSATPRDGSAGIRPRVLVWASSVPNVSPPADWRVREVYDLSYRENSPGKIYAQRVNARYHDGIAMFEAQARGQRAFWKGN